ncbi:MAG: CBS domain-containing protein [Candidatus Thermoplasmatota archaeon]|nr:CBS domain-containing protein [Candidatus Thermoplasmatota archaeon]
MVLTAADIMRKPPKTVSPDISVSESSKIMRDTGEGFLIIREGTDILGIVTEWDLVSKVMAAGIDPDSIKIEKIMTRNFIHIPPDTPTIKITETMREHGIRRLIVMNGRELLGVITSRDILRIFKDYVENVSEIVYRFGIK